MAEKRFYGASEGWSKLGIIDYLGDVWADSDESLLSELNANDIETVTDAECQQFASDTDDAEFYDEEEMRVAFRDIALKLLANIAKRVGKA